MARKNKIKKINPDRVTHTMKQLYANRANAIRTKIARRQAWAQEWSEKIEQIEEDMKTVEMEESQAIADLKLHLETTRALYTQASSSICLVQEEIEENHLKYKHEIARLEVEKNEGVREKTAEVSMLDQKEQDIRFFMANQTQLYEGLTQRQERMISLQDEQKAKLIKIQQSRVQRTERLTKEIEKKMQIFAEGFRKSMKIDDPIYEENAHLRERNLYISGQIQELRCKIPETRKRIQALSRERKECIKNWSLEVSSARKNLWKKLDVEADLKAFKTSIASQTEEFRESSWCSESVEEISEYRIRAVLKGVKKLITEARALVLIPRACLPEEAKLNDDEVGLRYMNRRDFIIKRRQHILELIQEVLQHGKPDYHPSEPPRTPEQSTPSPETPPEEAEVPSTSTSSPSPSPSRSTTPPRSPSSTTAESSSDALSLLSSSWDYPIEE